LDIETTGLSPIYSDITVVGIYATDGSYHRFVQLVGEEVTKANLLEALRGVDVIYTYNGGRFDLPFIHALLDIDLARLFRHHDLMLDCWRAIYMVASRQWKFNWVSPGSWWALTEQRQ